MISMEMCLLEWYEVFLGKENEVYKFYVEEKRKINQSKMKAASKGISLSFSPLYEILLEERNFNF